MTLKTIAAIANVSISTASRALSNSYDISSETREHVLRIAEEQGYFLKKKRIKIENRKRANFNIAIICPEIISSYYADRAQELVNEFRKQSCTCIVYSADFVQENLHDLLKRCINDNNIDAIINFSTIDIDSKDLPIPLILSHESKKWSYIYSDMQNGLNQAVSCLKRMGAQKIAFAGESNTLVREEYYLRSCAQYEMQNIGTYAGKARFDRAGILAAKYFLQMEQLPQGIICAYDEIAYGLIKTLKKSGVRVPEDVSVIGINNIPSSKYAFDGLTTISINFTKVSKAIVEDIITDLREETIRRRVYVCTARLIKRAT